MRSIRAGCSAICSRRCGAGWSFLLSPTTTSRRYFHGATSTSAGWLRTWALTIATWRGTTRKHKRKSGVRPRCGHRVRHRVPAGARGAGRRRHHALRRMEFLFGPGSLGLEPARLHRARRREADRLRAVPAPSHAIRGNRRLVHARHARDQQQDGALQGCLRAATSRAVHVRREAGWVFVARSCLAPESSLSHSHFGDRRSLHRRMSRRQCTKRTRDEHRTGQIPQHELHGRQNAHFQTVQLRIATAGAKIDAAGLVLRNDCLEAQRISEDGASLPLETRLRYKRNCAMAARMCIEAVDSLHEMAGANGIYDHYPLQRMFRDQRAAAGHFNFRVRCADARMGTRRARRRVQEPDDVMPFSGMPPRSTQR